MQTFLTRFFVFIMTNINTAFAHSFPASWKGLFTHAQPEQQTNRPSWRFVHRWRGYISMGDFCLVDLRKTSSNSQFKETVWQ